MQKPRTLASSSVLLASPSRLTLAAAVLSILVLSTAPAHAGGGGTVVFSEAAYTANEPAGSVEITVRRIAGNDGAISVSYRTVAGTATPGQDYTETSGSLDWANGEDGDRTFEVPILNDGLRERGETVQLELFDPVGGVSVGDPSTATLTILDDEIGGPPPPDCTPNDTTLCLQGNRFRVTSRWRRPNGDTGDGMAVGLTQDTGYFWFFNASNVEMIVKVLRGCANNDHFWVFAGGLTNVEVDLMVEDTSSGEIQEYLNALQTPFQPIQDIRAFASCP